MIIGLFWGVAIASDASPNLIDRCAFLIVNVSSPVNVGNNLPDLVGVVDEWVSRKRMAALLRQLGKIPTDPILFTPKETSYSVQSINLAPAEILRDSESDDDDFDNDSSKTRQDSVDPKEEVEAFFTWLLNLLKVPDIAEPKIEEIHKIIQSKLEIIKQILNIFANEAGVSEVCSSWQSQLLTFSSFLKVKEEVEAFFTCLLHHIIRSDLAVSELERIEKLINSKKKKILNDFAQVEGVSEVCNSWQSQLEKLLNTVRLKRLESIMSQGLELGDDYSSCSSFWCSWLCCGCCCTPQ